MSDQWCVGPMVCRTIGVSDQWCVGPMVCRTNGVSDQWCVGPMVCRTNGVSDQWSVTLLRDKRCQLVPSSDTCLVGYELTSLVVRVDITCGTSWHLLVVRADMGTSWHGYELTWGELTWVRVDCHPSMETVPKTYSLVYCHHIFVASTWQIWIWNKYTLIIIIQQKRSKW